MSSSKSTSAVTGTTSGNSGFSQNSSMGVAAAAASEKQLKEKTLTNLRKSQSEYEANVVMRRQLRAIPKPSESEKKKLEEVEKWLLTNNKPTYAGTRRRKGKKSHRRKRHTRRR